jgi:hypothetical protein
MADFGTHESPLLSLSDARDQDKITRELHRFLSMRAGCIMFNRGFLLNDPQ